MSGSTDARGSLFLSRHVWDIWLRHVHESQWFLEVRVDGRLDAIRILEWSFTWSRDRDQTRGCLDAKYPDTFLPEALCALPPKLITYFQIQFG